MLGTRAVAHAVLRTGVPTLVQASSVGVYSPGPKNAYVTEDYPRTGVIESSYSRHKALVERMLDRIESDHPTLRVVRLRPGLIFQRAVGTEIARVLRRAVAAGPACCASQRIPLIPAHPGAADAGGARRRRGRRVRPGAPLGRRRRVQHRGRAGARSVGRGRALPRRTDQGPWFGLDRRGRSELVAAVAAGRRGLGAPGPEGPADVLRPGPPPSWAGGRPRPRWRRSRSWSREWPTGPTTTTARR